MSHFPIEGAGKVLFVTRDPGAVMRALFKPTTRYLSLPDAMRRKRELLSAAFLFQPDLAYGFTGTSGGDMEKVLPRFASLLQGEQLYSRAMPVLAVPEHAPNRDSRVVLSDDRDFTGMRRLVLQFRRSPIDMESLRTTVELVGAELGRAALGRLQTVFTDTSLPALSPDDHHLGTTRMHRDSRQGVVDPNCRVHGVDNLYVAGPSVFPSGGFANPVLTIIALALRLADTLKGKRA
jgi:choline dehydrogenase-like flavoprotein